MSRIRVLAFTDVGLVRKRNEDCVLVAGWTSQARNGVLASMSFAPTVPFVCAVADGMGGHAGGNLASRTAIAAIAAHSSGWRTDDDVASTLIDTNEQVRDAGMQSALQGLGTTVAGLCILADALVVFNVGDSQVFSVVDGALQQISVDDSVFDENGRPTNIITQSLGQAVPVEPHVTVLPLQPGTYLLCSDGVSGVMTPEELGDVVAQPDVDDWPAAIISTTRRNGAADNFTFLIVEVPDLQRPNAETAIALPVAEADTVPVDE